MGADFPSLQFHWRVIPPLTGPKPAESPMFAPRVFPDE